MKKVIVLFRQLAIIPVFNFGLSGLLFDAAEARAAVFIVNSTLDTTDAFPGNGICADSQGNCILRAAVMKSNSFVGGTFINFN